MLRKRIIKKFEHLKIKKMTYISCFNVNYKMPYNSKDKFNNVILIQVK